MKKKNSSESAAKAQLLFYLYTLKQKGVIKKGILKFKENRDDIKIELTPENEKYIKDLSNRDLNIEDTTLFELAKLVKYDFFHSEVNDYTRLKRMQHYFSA